MPSLRVDIPGSDNLRDENESDSDSGSLSSISCSATPTSARVPSIISPYGDDITTLPSPNLSELGGNSEVFRSFNGMSPPLRAISRASSIRIPSGLKQAISFESLDRSEKDTIRVVTYQERVGPDAKPDSPEKSLGAAGRDNSSGSAKAPRADEASKPGSLHIPKNNHQNRLEPVSPEYRSVSDYVPKATALDPRSRVESPPSTAPIAPPSDSRLARSAFYNRPRYVRSGSSGSSIPTLRSIEKTNSQELAEEDHAKVYEAYDKNQIKSTWREVKALGRGAFSRVLLAVPAKRFVRPEMQEECSKHKVAIKIIDMATDAKSRERLQESLRREITVIKNLSHPCLIRMYAFNSDPDRALMVLPYCAGGDLFDLISSHRTKLSVKLIRRLFAEIVSAVVYLHSNNVVHRDIKLENVLLNIPIEELLAIPDPFLWPRALITLTDMGLSRVIDPENPNLTTRCGSEDYVPPELLMGQPYDGRLTDAWALGVVLYAVLEGRLPFDPPKHSGGGRARGRTAHRIARVEWSWSELKEVDETNELWQGMQIVQGCLQKRDKRLTTKQIAANDWVARGIQVELEAEDTDLVRLLFPDQRQQIIY